jgi:glycosyltransferase involved in cell wall biosynthesis
MTRVAFDLSILRHPFSGTARYAVELLAAMSAEHCSLDDHVEGINGWPRLRRGRRYGRYLNAAIDVGWYSVGALLAMNRRNFDVWYSPSNILPIRLRRPAVVTIHDLNFLILPEAYDRAYVRWAELNVERSARSAAKVVADSSFVAGELAARFQIPADRIEVAHLGIDHALRIEPARRRVGPVGRYALFVGQLEPHKNVPLLLDAWSHGVPNDLALVIVGGPGRDHERVALQCSRPELRGRVRLMGHVKDADLARLYADAHMFLFPSLLEGFGMPPLEAMARGIPTAVANTTSLPEVTGGAAVLFDPTDPIALTTIISALADDADLRQRLIAQGRAHSSRFTWHATAGRVWTAIEQGASRV